MSSSASHIAQDYCSRVAETGILLRETSKPTSEGGWTSYCSPEQSLSSMLCPVEYVIAVHSIQINRLTLPILPNLSDIRHLVHHALRQHSGDSTLERKRLFGCT